MAHATIMMLVTSSIIGAFVGVFFALVCFNAMLYTDDISIMLALVAAMVVTVAITIYAYTQKIAGKVEWNLFS